MIRSLFFAVSLLLSCACFAQQSFQLNKQQKKELKQLQKEGWQTLEPSADLEKQFAEWCQKEAEQNAGGSNKYLMQTSEVEDSRLEIASRRAWNDACSAIRRQASASVAGSIKTEESSTTIDGKAEEHSDVRLSQRSKTDYAGTMNDIIKVVSIYKKTKTGYVVKMIVAKENK